MAVESYRCLIARRELTMDELPPCLSMLFEVHRDGDVNNTSPQCIMAPLHTLDSGACLGPVRYLRRKTYHPQLNYKSIKFAPTCMTCMDYCGINSVCTSRKFGWEDLLRNYSVSSGTCKFYSVNCSQQQLHVP